MSTENSFGTFARTSRKALGLNLREFCRRNGFDPGNISRMERGISPPPQGQQILDALAKALKFKPGTERWEQFFELAAASNGRIPAELLEGSTATAKLPNLLRQLRGGQGHRNWVTARHLAEWANTFAARSLLPQLVRRLVAATGCELTYVEFPAGEQVQRSGWDGVVEAKGTDQFVPGGVSGWEMGVEKSPGEKFEEDFVNRKKDPEGLSKPNTTFVFVTPRHWQKKGEKVKEKAKLGIWKDVRIYDSATLEEWLERAPAVDVWLARILGIRTEGLTDFDEYWKNLAAVTVPSLSPEVFLASRGKEVEDLQKWLAGPPDALVIETRSPTEAVDFVAAFSRNSSIGDTFLPRALLVETREAWRAMAASGSKLILIAHPTLAVEPELVAEAVRQGHHVILCSERADGRVRKLALPRSSCYDLQQALEKTCGFDHFKARERANQTGGSLTILKRILARYPGSTPPDWSHQPEAELLLPFLLAGRWDESNQEDRKVLESLAVTEYHQLSILAERWQNKQDAPLIRKLAQWSFVSRDDSWYLLANALKQNHLDRFEQVAVDVLGEDDTSFEMHLHERGNANPHGRNPWHSQELRTGLSETLALLGCRPPEELAVAGMVKQVVGTLLQGKNWRRWASLSRQLPFLAEADPDTFLTAAEQDLQQSNSALVELFNQDCNPLLSLSPHTGLLWALEGLAWDRSWLPRVVKILVQLEQKIPTGAIENRPLSSLQEIFTPRWPQTNATVQERVKLLGKIVNKLPSIGWRLLIGLLPRRFQTRTLTWRPAFRDWAIKELGLVSGEDYWFQVNESSKLLLDLLGHDLPRMKDLLERIEDLPGPIRSKFLERLGSFDVASMDPNTLQMMSAALRKTVARHRQFANDDRALPPEDLTQLEKAQERFLPIDLVARYAWLFDSLVEELNWQNKGQVDFQDRRFAALREIETEAGWKGILALAEMVKLPQEMGSYYGELQGASADSRVIPNLLTRANEKTTLFARGYSRSRFHKAGWPWVESLDMSSWSIRQVGEFFLHIGRYERRIGDCLSSKGIDVEEYYWSNEIAFPIPMDADDITFVVGRLLRYNQPYQAFHVFGIAIHQKTPINSALAFKALEAGQNVLDHNHRPEAYARLRIEISQLFQELQLQVLKKDSDVDVERLAELEWRYLTFLDGHPASPETLSRLLQQEPKRFIDLLTLIYPGQSTPEKPNAPRTEEELTRSQNAYRLLGMWDRIPGTLGNGSIDGDILHAWVEMARQLAEDKGCLEICDSRIGELLARRAQVEEDGSWPCIPIRDSLEEIGSVNIFDGFELGILNRREANFQSTTQRGEKARALAHQYRAWADQSNIDWPMTAASLRRVAEEYDEKARREGRKSLLDR